MNRRNFITRALVGIAAIPLLSKLVHARPQQMKTDTPSPRDCSYYFSHGRTLSDAELRRKQMLGYLRSNEYMETTAEAVARIFADFDYDQIDTFCEEHGLIMETRLNGMIRISMPWRITVVNTFASL